MVHSVGVDAGREPLVDSAVPDPSRTLHVLLRQASDPLRSYLTSRIPDGMKGRIVVDEILQEVWVAAFKSGKLLTTLREAEFMSWLFRVANRTMISAMRFHSMKRRDAGRERAGRDQTTSLVDLFERIPGPQRTPSSVAARNEIAADVRAAIEQLTEPHRRVIWMHHIDGLHQDEIAKVLEVSPAAVRGILYRGMIQLSRIMRQRGPQGSSG